ncbi:hypothetical protein HMPREF1022_01982 [Desulfovibrio sp. 6_1_46AFAA]|nr:hypothetical protein HMPREF1022_01982 [Desulfovibrio sp. 6_1_46AFAA]
MMRYMLAIFLLFLTGCGAYVSGTMYQTTLEYTPVNLKGWELHTPEKHMWTERNKTYLPQYFSEEDAGSLGWPARFNYFYAKYAGEQDTQLVLWVRLTGAFEVWQDIASYWLDSEREAPLQNNANSCNKKCFGVEISTNAVNMDFDTHGVFIMKGDETISSELIALNKGFLCKDTAYLNHDIYNLADPKTIALMKPNASSRVIVILPSGEGISKEKNFTYPSFGFKFPLNCRDIENTTLVISGFTYKGKPIPPLKVRLNYTDLSQVPGYEGPPATQQAQ